MSGANEHAAFLAQVGMRRLTPETTSIFEGTFGLLHCAVKGDTLYRGVFAVLLFPISHPDRFISLRYMDQADKVIEIGVIERINAFSAEQRELVRTNLAKHYHERFIQRVYDVTNRHGLLFFQVETQLGREEFVMPWKQERAEPYGEKGKVLHDALDNRYVLQDVSALPQLDQQRFTNYVYW